MSYPVVAYESFGWMKPWQYIVQQLLWRPAPLIYCQFQCSYEAPPCRDRYIPSLVCQQCPYSRPPERAMYCRPGQIKCRHFKSEEGAGSFHTKWYSLRTCLWMFRFHWTDSCPGRARLLTGPFAFVASESRALREGSVTQFGTPQSTAVFCYESPKVLFNKCEVFLIFYLHVCVSVCGPLTAFISPVIPLLHVVRLC